MTEEVFKPVTAEDVKPVVEEGKVSLKDIEVVEKEIEAKDTAKIDALKGDINGQFKAQLEELKSGLEAQYKEQLNTELKTYKDQIDASYTKKFDEVNTKLEEMAPRKGFVQNTAPNPYEEIAKEATPETVAQPVDAIKEIQNLDATQDREAGEAFFNSLHK